jgi:hypothetical protein
MFWCRWLAARAPLLKQVTKVWSSKHPEIDWMLERPLESHNDGKVAGYFLIELRSLLNNLDYHAKPLYNDKKTPLHSMGYKWEVHMVLYKTPRGTRECHVH